MQVIRHLGALIGVLIVVGCGAAATPAGTSAQPSVALAPASPPAAATLAPAPTVAPAPTATPAPAPTATPNWNDVPPVAEDQAGVARQLAMAELAIRDPNVAGAELVWMGHLEQLAISQLNDYPEWKDQALAALPDKVRASVAGTLEAGRQLRLMRGPTPRTLPDWTIVAPAPAEDLLTYYREAEQRFGVPWYYLASINLVETRMGRIHGVSSAGALGPMQFMQPTWDAYGEGDVNDPHDAILGAARYLKAAGAPGDMARALYAYNHSQPYVNAITAYAEVMRADPDAFRGYYGWQVYYATGDGTFWLKVGWKKA